MSRSLIVFAFAIVAGAASACTTGDRSPSGDESGSAVEDDGCDRTAEALCRAACDCTAGDGCALPIGLSSFAIVEEFPSEADCRLAVGAFCRSGRRYLSDPAACRAEAASAECRDGVLDSPNSCLGSASDEPVETPDAGAVDDAGSTTDSAHSTDASEPADPDAAAADADASSLEEGLATYCTSDCGWSGDGRCQDTGRGASDDAWCDWGTDCSDCGARTGCIAQVLRITFDATAVDFAGDVVEAHVDVDQLLSDGRRLPVTRVALSSYFPTFAVDYPRVMRERCDGDRLAIRMFFLLEDWSRTLLFHEVLLEPSIDGTGTFRFPSVTCTTTECCVSSGECRPITPP